MADPSIEVRKRRAIVALPENPSKTRRALTREVKVSEGTIGRDRKMLAHPELDCCNLRAQATQLTQPTVDEPTTGSHRGISNLC